MGDGPVSLVLSRFSRIAAAAVWLLVFPPLAAPSHGQPPRASGFSLFAHAMMDREGRPTVKITASVPHGSLVFLKRDGAFEAEYQLYVRVLSADDKELLATAVLKRAVVESEYRETRSHKNSSSVSHQVALPPGDYVIECTVRVKDTQLAFSKETAVTVPDFLGGGIGLGEPRLHAVSVDSSARAVPLRPSAESGLGDETRIEGGSLADLLRQPAFEVDVYLEEADDTTLCNLIYAVENAGKSTVLYGRKRLPLFGRDNRFLVSFDVGDWEPGPYVLAVKVLSGDPPRGAETSFRFTLQFTRAMLTRRLDDTLEMLSLIADDDEVKRLREAPADERAAVWMDFWKRRDPSPGTEENEALEEHFRRLRYAEENFSSGEAGWRSDRGRVYIRYGQPDETELRSDPYFQGQYLIWRYYDENLTFVFYDRYGLGEYRLTSSTSF